MTWQHLVQALAVFIVLAEALNKLERADLFDGRTGIAPRVRGLLALLQPWVWRRPRVVTVLKVMGWAALAWGAVASMLTPPNAAHVAVIAGFALLIIRSRLKEG